MIYVRLFFVILMLSGCIHRKITIEPLRNECSALLAKYLPLFELPNSIEVYANCCCPEYSTASAVGNTLFFGLWKIYRIEIESEKDFYALSADAREFILCHELAHIKLGHLQGYYIWQTPPPFDRAVAHRKEYDADALAVTVIGHTRGALKFFGEALLDLFAWILCLLAPFFMLSWLIRRKKVRMRTVARNWLISALITCLALDWIFAFFGTHPACFLRIVHVITKAPY